MRPVRRLSTEMFVCRLQSGQGGVRNQDPLEGKEAEILGKCITCCACREYCPTGADPYDLILKAQEKFKAFPIAEKDAALMDLAFQVPGEVVAGDPDKPILSLCMMERLIPRGRLTGSSLRE